MPEYLHFSAHELACKCGCGGGSDDMHPVTMGRLGALRDSVGALPLSSAYRCPAHNTKVSRSGPNGPHTTGQAVDILCKGSKAREVVARAVTHGFTGIGVNQKGDRRFIHLDDDDLDDGPGRPRPWMWSY
jgi:uncharacterized protein YcbK (DUF882 family)